MINFLKNSIYVLNFTILFAITAFTILFFFKIKINFLSNFIVVVSVLALSFKLLYWYSIKESLENNFNFSKLNLFLLRLSFCIFTYITPTYYLLQQPNLVVSDYVILITLIIVSIFVFTGMIIEKLIFYIELKHSLTFFYEKK